MHLMRGGIQLLWLAAGCAGVAGPLHAQDSSHACFANDSIVMGHRIQPTQAEIASRLDTPACRAVLGGAGSYAEQSAATRRDLARIDDEIAAQSRALAAGQAPAAN
jgi:hypothetical protein